MTCTFNKQMEADTHRGRLVDRSPRPRLAHLHGVAECCSLQLVEAPALGFLHMQ